MPGHYGNKKPASKKPAKPPAKKGSVEMKAKMAKLRKMKGKK
jgi:hypothetical protein